MGFADSFPDVMHSSLSRYDGLLKKTLIIGASCLYTVYMALITIIIGFVCVPCLLSQSGSRWVSRIWCYALLFGLRWISGTRSRIKGLNHLPKGPFILASKHQSAWEVLALSYLFKESVMVAKRELFYIPIFGWYLWRTGCIGLERSESRQALTHLFEQAKALVGQGRILVIFPEGTRANVHSKHAPYKKGVALLYRELNIPVVPCALNSGVFWPRKSIVHIPGCIEAEILSPLGPGMPLKAFMNELETRIETHTRKLVDHARIQF